MTQTLRGERATHAIASVANAVGPSAPEGMTGLTETVVLRPSSDGVQNAQRLLARWITC